MVRSVRSIGGFVVALAAISGIIGDAQQGQQQPAQPPTPPVDTQQPIFRTGISYVRVDVIVTDKKGDSVADLKATDFELLEDNKAQTIDTFRLIKLDGGATPTADGPPRPIRNDRDEEQEAQRDDVRLFAIFLDDYHVRQPSSVSVREPLANFVATELGPSDMLGLMYPLESVAAVRMTRNHDAVVRGVQQFVGRKGDYTPRNRFEEQYAHYPAEAVEQIRNQVSLSAIRALIVHMGSLKEGRKSLILVSEGYTNMLPPQLRDPIASAPGFGNPDRRDPGAGIADANEDRAAFFANVEMQQQLRDVYDVANRNNVAIYAVDPRGLAVGEFDIEQNINRRTDAQYLGSTLDTLRTLADNSDGRAIVNRNDLAAGMKQIVRDSSAYYLIGYNSSQAPSDGKFHEIKVRVKRPGLQVRARKGYWALTPDDAARALAPPKAGPPKAVENALAAVTERPRSRVIRTWIGTARGENGKTKVTFVWEPTAPAATDRGAGADTPSRVVLTAVSQDAAYFRGPARSGVSFDANPGKMQLRISVEGAASQVLDSETRDVTVPDLTSSQPTLGTPQVLRARTVRELQLLKADPAAVPTAAREFSRTERLLIRVPAYGPGETALAPSVHLLNRAGQPMAELPASPGAAPGLHQIEVPLASLAPGEYLVEIKASPDAAAPRELVGFRVTG